MLWANMADRDPPAGSRRLKIAARMPDNEVPWGKPADWLSKDDGKYTVCIVPLFCLHVSGFSMARWPVVTGHLVIILMCFSWLCGTSLSYGTFVHIMIYVFSGPGDQWWTGHLANILMYSGWSHGALLSYSTLNVHCPWNGSKWPGNWSLGSILCLVNWSHW